MITEADDDDVVTVTAEELARVESTLYTANGTQLSTTLPTTLAHSIRILVRRDADAATSRAAAVRHVALVINALHTRERNFPSADVSLSALVPEDVLVSAAHVLATRALLDLDESIATDAVRVLLALLHAQAARPAATSYWSRAFFFECDFAESLIGVLIRAATSAQIASPLLAAAPLALHALAALCNARPVENADVRPIVDFSSCLFRCLLM
jgi:hypothetical protein